MLDTKIGNYKVTAAIGEGGMGTVYRAVHESLGRAAAVKVLLPEISSSHDMVARFFREARSAASIQHSGIVEVFDFGFLPDGRAYIIMELLEGENLASRLRRPGRMPHVRALQIVRSVARALHAAHERGIVHRDIKPDNIFLVPDPEMPTGERIKLLDFGIAKLGGDGDKAGLTQTGAVMGTPLYMAPEQCRGAGAVDRRADLYALGCILYEILCGRPPFVAEGAGDIIARHLYFAPEPPRAQDPSIPPPLEALVLTLLQKDPAHRPPTALALVEAIDRLGVPAGGGPLPLGTPAPEPTGTALTTLSGGATSISTHVGAPSRRRLVIAAAGAVATIAGVAIVVLAAGSGQDSANGPAAGAIPDAAIIAMPMPPPFPDAAVAAASAAPSLPDAAVVAPAPTPDAAMIVEVPADAAVSAEPRPEPEPTKPAAVKPKQERTSPRTVLPTLLEANRISGDKNIVPDPATKTAIEKSGLSKLVSSFKLCVDKQGAISSVSQLKGTGFRDYDTKITSEMKRWRYKPYLQDGKAVPACTAVTFVYSQVASTPPPPSPPLSPPSPPLSPPSPPPEVRATCTRSSFTPVLQAKQPDEATVQAALARLKKCQKELPADVYADLQAQLISKL